MRKIIALALMLSLSSVAPATVFAQGNGGNPNPPADNSHNPGKKPVITLAQGGIIATAVAVLGLIALAASNNSGDATPATTSHPGQ
jgi:hypothetical protein